MCVQARGKEDAHVRQECRHNGKPIIAVDYKAFGEHDEDDKLTAIVVKDHMTRMMGTYLCEAKGQATLLW